MSHFAPLTLPKDRPARVLIVRTGAMGDVLHAMPAVSALRAAHPDWYIGWAIEPRWRPLLEACESPVTSMPLVNRIHEVPTRSWNKRPFSLTTLKEILALRRELRAERYDLCVDMQGLIRSSVVGWLAGAPSFVGLAAPREPIARLLYNKRIQTEAPHVIDRGCELLSGAVGEPLCAETVPLPIDPAAEEWCDQQLAMVLPEEEAGRFALLAPTAGWGAKQWPAENYGKVAAALAAEGYTPLINVADENDPVAAQVIRASGGTAVPVWCSLPQLTALLRRSSIMIAGDTGPLHLAAALGRPVIGLFGPTDPGRTGPYGTRSQVLRHPSSRVDHRRHSVPEDGLTRITVEEVVAAALEALEPAPQEQLPGSTSEA